MQEMNQFTHENFPSFPAYSVSMQNSFPETPFSRSYTASLPYYHTSLTVLNEQTLNPTCISSNSATSDEAEDHQIKIIDERRQRRMISNRESARRSRMRKQRHLDELWSMVLRLRTENHNLLNKVNDLSASHDRVVQENSKLRAEALDLHQMLRDLQAHRCEQGPGPITVLYPPPRDMVGPLQKCGQQRQAPGLGVRVPKKMMRMMTTIRHPQNGVYQWLQSTPTDA
ncbi:bZIP transcription factor 53-like [Andrographis paniculata]|uniref:bZIP transcription factor 53-like n=1 Tax=Andrographis paniculata TaxID=175694 RepID=UPI0021E88C82|nr:bZIP transcription factor 53-like [Andrographis paniculata]